MTTKPLNETLVPGTTRSTDVGWYKKQLPDFGNDVYDLLVNYSEVPTEDVNAHILNIVGPEEDFTSYFANLYRGTMRGTSIHIHV
jgi:hypothetical protein